MGSVNKVILVGNLGRDAELRYTPGGAAVATLNLATTEVWNDRNNQRQEKTEWHRIVLWGKTAESLQEYLTKGKQIYVEGRLQTRQWDDKDGNKRYTTEIKADRVTLLGGGGGGGARRRDGSRRGSPTRFGGRAADGANHRRRHPVLISIDVDCVKLKLAHTEASTFTRSIAHADGCALPDQQVCPVVRGLRPRTFLTSPLVRTDPPA